PARGLPLLQIAAPTGVACPSVLRLLARASRKQSALVRRVNAVWEGRRGEREFADEFLRKADRQLVAFAKAYGCVLITHEQPEDPKKKRKSVKIPDACQAFDIEWADTFKMLRDEKTRLVLGR
ncbi:MAG: DUF4411 family protein, partial [Propionibacteriaceae bacterium]|nr:DUF4411 family protein [Propionibacteriaceae bacterium]